MANKTWEFEQGLQTAIKDWDKFNFYCDSIITSVKSESTKEE